MFDSDECNHYEGCFHPLIDVINNEIYAPHARSYRWLLYVQCIAHKHTNIRDMKSMQNLRIESQIFQGISNQYICHQILIESQPLFIANGRKRDERKKLIVY